MKPKPEIVGITITFSRKLKGRLKNIAHLQGKSVSELATEVLTDYVTEVSAKTGLNITLSRKRKSL